MRRSNGFMCVFALPLLLSACGGPTSAACEDACTEGQSRCDGLVVQTCGEGADGCLAWGERETCLADEFCLEIPDAHCDGDFFARFIEDGVRQNELRVVVRPMVDPRTSPPEDHPEAEWSNQDSTTVLFLQLPRDVSAVATYYLSDDTLATYITEGRVYTPHREDAEVTITVNEWEGAGGVAAGVFERVMHSPLGAGTSLTNGEWRAPIIAWE